MKYVYWMFIIAGTIYLTEILHWNEWTYLVAFLLMGAAQ